ncbi:MAG: hypothetical protein QOF21_2726 [Actinomycetota bacterium]
MQAASSIAEDLETSYVTAAADIRAYFLSGDAKSLEEFTTERIRSGDISGRLQGLLMGRRPLLRQVSNVAEAGRAWRLDGVNPLITLQQAGRSEEVISGYRDGPSVRLYQTAADELRELRDEVGKTVATTATREDDTRRDASRFVFAAMVVGLAALVVVRVVSRFWISRPISQLAKAVRSQDDDVTAIRIAGATEVAELARDVESLQTRLREELDQAVRTREALSQNAAVLMSLRTQLETSPDNLPAGWAVSAQLVPATGIVAGDCYDIDYTADGRMSVIVVDVAGHGASSAVVALRAKELLRAGIRTNDDPSAAVAWANHQLSDLENGLFVTAFVAVVNFTSGLVRFVNAGHPAALLADGVNTLELGPTGPLLGPFAGEWKTREAIISAGQMLVCYTDGLVEVRNDEREEFGVDRLRAVLTENYGDDTDTVVKQTLAEVDAFVGGRADDDITLTIVARASLP